MVRVVLSHRGIYRAAIDAARAHMKELLDPALARLVGQQDRRVAIDFQARLHRQPEVESRRAVNDVRDVIKKLAHIIGVQEVAWHHFRAECGG